MNYNIKNYLFFTICFTLIFNNVPAILQMNFFGGSLGKKLVFYPVIIGIIYTVYGLYKKQDKKLWGSDYVKKYFLLYIGISLLSLGIGLYTYPYYDLILQGPVNQIQKLPFVLNFFNSLDIQVDSKILIVIWIILRAIKNVIIECIYTFGISYMIFYWYKNNWKLGIQCMQKAIICSVAVLLMYSSIEIFALSNFEFAKSILVTINPFLHTIKVNNTWWPPLLWPGQQLRSVFAEPSYFGIYAAFAMPWLWSLIYNASSKRKLTAWYLLLTLFTFCLFLTKARTAVALFCGELALLVIIMAAFRDRAYIIRFIGIICCVGIAFLGSLGFISITNQQNTNVQEGARVYMNDNLASLASESKRSNQARYAIMETNLYIGLAHPLIGVGPSLQDAYVTDYLPTQGQQSKEIQMWLTKQKEQGILKFSIPSLGEYIKRFAETGFIGLVVYLLAPLVLLRKLLKIILTNRRNFKTVSPYIFLLISLVGIVTSGVGDSLTITYCYWILLGLGYAMCYGTGMERVGNAGTKDRNCH